MVGETENHDAHLEFDVPDWPQAPAAARTAVAAMAALGLLSTARLRDVQLMVSELVANAVRHAGPRGRLRMRLRVSREALRVEVRDEGPGFDVGELPAADEASPGGWGLRIIGAIADRWGIEREPSTTVWFEISRPQTAPEATTNSP